MKTITNLNEIDLYITMLMGFNNKFYNDALGIRVDLAKEFDIDVSTDDINKVFEPTIIEDEEDLRIQYENVC